VNAAIEDGKIDQLSIVVLDELHMLDEENRGYLIEVMITKLLCLQQGTQLIGMSATLSNPQLIADWLKAKFYISKYRAIPIEEHLLYENTIYPTANARQFVQTASQLSSNPFTQKPLTAARTIEKPLHHHLEVYAYKVHAHEVQAYKVYRVYGVRP
jgi:replicative superfamily II helicase